MLLNAGDRLGPYEIVAAIGAGGMGEVYRARDVRLGRDVAVKVLPPRLASDPQGLARFEREARAVAALSRPARSGRSRGLAAYSRGGRATATSCSISTRTGGWSVCGCPEAIRAARPRLKSSF